MADTWSDPTAAGAVYADPTAPVFIAPIVLPEPDPVYRDDALFASSSANWRAVPVPPPPLPILNEAGELVVVPVPPTPAELRDQAVAALHAPPVGPPLVASRGGARSTYSTPEPVRAPGGWRSQPQRPAGSVTSSPQTWLPQSGAPTAPAPPAYGRPPGPRGPGRGMGGGIPSGMIGSMRNMPTPTVAWQPTAPPPIWQPAPLAAPSRPTSWAPRSGPGPTSYQDRVRAARSARTGRTGGRRKNKGWIPGVIVLAFVVGANVLPHLNGLFGSHSSPAPAAVSVAVDAYYTDLERGNVNGAQGLVCDGRRAAFIVGSTASGSDVNRGIDGHEITSARTAGSGKYTVHVNVTDSAGTSGPATIKVVSEDGAYHLCGGTTP